MKKSDLKTGMLVETRDGRYMLVMRNTPEGDNFVQPSLKGLHNEGEEGVKVTWKPFDCYDEDLTASRKYPERKSNDIVKVYGYSSNMAGAQIAIGRALCRRKLLWERPKPKQYVFVSHDDYVAEKAEDVREKHDVLFEVMEINEAIEILKDRADK